MRVLRPGLSVAMGQFFLLFVMALTIGIYLLSIPSTFTVTKMKTAEKRIELLSTQIDKYRESHSMYPATLARLVEWMNAQADLAKHQSVLSDPWGNEWTYTVSESSDSYALASHNLDVSRKDTLKKNALQFVSVILFVAAALVLVIYAVLCSGRSVIRRCFPLLALLVIILFAFTQNYGFVVPLLSSAVTFYAALVISVLLLFLSVLYLWWRWVPIGMALLMSAVFSVVVLLRGVT